MSKKGESTKALFLRVSEELFLKDGYDAVTVAVICKKAEKAKGLFFYYFEQKETVLKLLTKNEIEMMSGQLTGFLEQLPGTSVVKMSFLMNAMVSRNAQTPKFMSYFGAEGPPEFFEGYSHALRDDFLLPIIKKIVFEGVALGEFKRISEREVDIIYMGISTFMHRNFDTMMKDDEVYANGVAGISSVLEKSIGVPEGTIKIN